MSTVDGPTDIKIKLHFTLHPREHTDRHRSDSRCNPSVQIGKMHYPFAVHDVFVVPQKNKFVTSWLQAFLIALMAFSPPDVSNFKYNSLF
jgi:hypothetical protein